MNSKAFFFLAILFFSAFSAFAENEGQEAPGLLMNFYKDTCPQAEDIITEQVKLLYKRHKNTAFSWLRNIFHDCFVEVHCPTLFFFMFYVYWSSVEMLILGSACCLWFWKSCDASLLLDSTRRVLSEKETDRSFGMRNFRYIEDIKEAVERECPGVVSCADILVLSARDGIVAVTKIFLYYIS